MSGSNRQDITFGVELEFLTPTGVVDRAMEKCEQRTLTRMAFANEIARLATDTPIATVCVNHHGSSSCVVCEGTPEAIVSPGVVAVTQQRFPQTGNIHTRYRYFVVQPEYLSAFVRQGDCTGLEISTPVLDMDELDNGLPRLSRVLSALGMTTMKVMANISCGLHIHVGTKNGMRLLHAKKVATLAALLDYNVLRMLLPYGRSQVFAVDSIGQASRFALRISRDSLYENILAAENHPAMHEYLPASWTSGNLDPRWWNSADPSEFRGTLKLIWGTKTLAALQDGLRLREGSRAGVALHLREAGQGKPLTLAEMDWSEDDEEPPLSNYDFEGTQSTYEFRFPQMSFDKDFIKHWAELSCKIVELAMLPAPQFSALLESLASVIEKIESNEGDGLELIWPALGLQHQTPFWAAQLERQKRGELISHLDSVGALQPLPY